MYCSFAYLDLDHIIQQIFVAFNKQDNEIIWWSLLTLKWYLSAEAFGTINHEVLLQKCEVIKFSEQGIQWFSYQHCDQIF